MSQFKEGDRVAVGLIGTIRRRTGRLKEVYWVEFNFTDGYCEEPTNETLYSVPASSMLKLPSQEIYAQVMLQEALAKESK